jgi:hypothetical protein
LFAKACLQINGLALELEQIVKTVRFIFDGDENTVVPEIGIRPLDIA